MKAEIAVMTGTPADDDAIQKAGEIIKNGGLVAFPTETVYGLGGNAIDPQASKKIYAAKGRPSDNPLIVHIARIEDLYKIVKEVPDKAKILADNYWPGPLTMIFRKKEIIPYETTGGLDTVAVRFPDNKTAQALILAWGGFIAAPSANLSGRPSTTKAQHVIEDLGDRIDMIIDGGESRIGLESTIVDFTEEFPVILRPGYIGKKQLEKMLGKVEVDKAIIDASSKTVPKAPGMKYRHYAPKGDLIIIAGPDENVICEINKRIGQKNKEGLKTAVLCKTENREKYNCENVFDTGCIDDEEKIAHRLFDILRRLDEEGISFICSESFATPRLGDAIMNRLSKAAGNNIINV